MPGRILCWSPRCSRNDVRRASGSRGKGAGRPCRLRSGGSASPCHMGRGAAVPAAGAVDLAERMEHLGCLPSRGEPPRHVTVAQVVDQPLWHLAGVVDAMARPELPDVAPSDILRGPLNADHAVVAAWRSVARELFLATADLQRADLQPWLTQGPAGWYVLGDIADTVCALLALDAKAECAGVLPTDGGGEKLTVRLLIASDVARLARMWGHDSAADRAETGPRSRLQGGLAPVYMVRTAEDLVVALQHLSALMRPIKANADPRSAGDRPGLKTARVVAAGQARLCLEFAAWADATPEAEHLGAAFRYRASLHRDLHAVTPRLVDVIPHRSTLPLIQQSEIVMRAGALRGRNPDCASLMQLNQASHEVAVTLGQALKREVWSHRTIRIGVTEESDTPVARPITNTRHPFYRACRGLTEDPPPIPNLKFTDLTGERTRLRRALAAATTTATRTPRRMPERELRARQLGVALRGRGRP